MIKIYSENEKGKLTRGYRTDSGADMRVIGYVKVNPIYENIDGIKVRTGGELTPLYKFETDSEFVIIQPHETILLHTGIHAINAHDAYFPETAPDQYLTEIQSRPRSGLSLKLGLHVHLGTIDQSYMGSIGVIATNLNTEPIKISAFERVGQLVENPIHITNKFDYITKDEFDIILSEQKAARSQNGYGSTGKK